MRYIHKGNADSALVLRHKNPPTTEAEATVAWRNFRGKRKDKTRDRCLTEQFYLCGYSEIDLTNKIPVVDNTGQDLSQDLGRHLEHIEPKSVNPARTFDHQNLIVCAIDDVKFRNLVKSDVFGGHAKLKWYHSQGLIHPLLPGCRNYFFYEVTTGRVKPRLGMPRREQAKARLTIYKLNLNAPALMLWRRTWLQQAEQIIMKLINDTDALQQFAQAELLPTNNRLRPFHSAQRQLFGRLGEQVCQQNNPPL